MFGMKEVAGPAPILVAALDHDFDGVSDATIRLYSRIPQIVESAQDVVVPEWRGRGAEAPGVGDLSGPHGGGNNWPRQKGFRPPSGPFLGERFWATSSLRP